MVGISDHPASTVTLIIDVHDCDHREIDRPRLFMEVLGARPYSELYRPLGVGWHGQVILLGLRVPASACNNQNHNPGNTRSETLVTLPWLMSHTNREKNQYLVLIFPCEPLLFSSIYQARRPDVLKRFYIISITVERFERAPLSYRYRKMEHDCVLSSTEAHGLSKSSDEL